MKCGWWGGVVLIACTLAVPSARAQDCNTNGVPDAADLFPAAFESSSVSLALPAPGRLVVTDLDDDGLPDVAVVHTLSDRVTTWRNTGGAAFTAGTTIVTGDSPLDVLAVRGSVELLCGTPPCSRTDLLVAISDEDSVSRFTNQGDGTFVEAAGSPDTIPVASALPWRLVAADLSTVPDGYLDAVTMNRGNDQVSVFLGDADDDLTYVGSGPTVADPVDGALADVNGDGTLDLLVAGLTGDAVRLHGGGASPPPPADVAIVDQPVAMVAADLSGDGLVDLAVVSGADQSVEVFSGNGAGAFAPAGTIAIGGAPSAIVDVDLDGDGLRDLAVTRADGDSVALLRNQGDGTFTLPVDVTVGNNPVAIAAGDLDLDGRPDLVVSNAVSADLTILRQLPEPRSFDCNGTNVPDECELAAGDCNENTVPDTCELTRRLRFAPAVASVLANDRNSALATGDLTGDGQAEVLVADTLDDAIYVLPVGLSGIATTGSSVAAPDNPRRMLVADLEPDGDADVVVGNASGSTLGIFRNTGGTLGAQTTVGLGRQPIPIVAVDLDGDTAPELVVGTDQPGISVLPNEGSAFGLPVEHALVGLPTSMVAGDLDGDGDRDLVAMTFTVPGGATQLEVFRNAGGVLTLEPPLATPPVGWIWAAVVGGDFDVDGDLDLGVFELNLLLGDARLVVFRTAAGVPAREQILPVHSDLPVALGFSGSTSPVVVGALLFQGVPIVTGDFDGDTALDLAAGLGGRIVDFRNDGLGNFGPGAPAPAGPPIRQLVAADVDGDGTTDLVAGDASHRLALVRSVSAPSASECAVAGELDECAADYSDCNDNTVADACELASVDADGDGIADCVELGAACGNCRDDDTDGTLDLADATCPSTALTLRRVRAVRKGGGRLKISGELPTLLDDAAPVVTVGSDASALFCGPVALRKRGAQWRLRPPGDVLRSLVFNVRRRSGTTRVKAVVNGTLPAGTALRLSVQTGGEAYSGSLAPGS
jgi:hypothetical protein